MTYDPGTQPHQSTGQPQYQRPAYPTTPTAESEPVYPTAPPPARQRSTALAVVLIAIAAVALLGGIVGLSAGLQIGPAANLIADRGVEMCKAIAAEKSTGSGSGTEKLTAAEYQRIRKQFNDSRYADIRSAGDHFVDVVWQAQGVGNSNDDQDPGAMLALVGSLFNAYSDLSGACANHGIVLPPLSTN